jgi:hypothetical protein
MCVTDNRIAELHPTLYHMAEYASWESIKHLGLLSTTALLDRFEISGSARTAIEENRRPSFVEIRNAQGGRAVIRDQRAMSDSKLASCLTDGLSPTQWYRILNGKVFFWLTEERLRRMMRAYRGRRQLVLEVDTEELLKQHSDDVLLTPLNTGCTRPMAFPRGLGTFLPPNQYPFEDNKRKKGGARKAIVELTVDYSVADILRLTHRATHRVMKNGVAKLIDIVYERS